jgi:hypothetical protein
MRYFGKLKIYFLFCRLPVLIILFSLTGHFGFAAEELIDRSIKLSIPFPPFTAIETSIENAALNKPCDPITENRSSDLCAQWKAADAAAESAKYTKYSFRLGVAGLGVGFLTLLAAAAAALFAKKASEEAKRSADVADHAVKTSKNLGEKQIQAYLYCKSAHYIREKDQFLAHLEIGNAGLSPASDVAITGTMTISQIGGLPKHPRIVGSINSDENKISLQPVVSNGSITAKIYFLLDYDFREENGYELGSEKNKVDSAYKRMIFANGSQIQFNFIVRWNDVFEQRHEFELVLSTELENGQTAKRRRNRGLLDFHASDSRYQGVEVL